MQLKMLPKRLSELKTRLSPTGIAGSTIREKSRSKWIATRANYLRENPLCKHCELIGHISIANELDHIIPLCMGGQEFDEDNYQGLCRDCHRIKSNKEAGERTNHFNSGGKKWQE